MKKNLIFALFIGLLSCQSNTNRDQTVHDDSPVRGSITIAADESVKRIIDAEVQIYQMNYPAAKLNVVYMPENKAIQNMMADEARIAAVTRELNEKEKAILTSKGYPTAPTIIALDGVALIINKKAGIKSVSLDDLKAIFEGKSKMQIGFDNSNSSNLNFLKKKLGISDISKAKISAAAGTEDLIKFIEKDAGTIGVIGMSWISDIDSKVGKDIERRVKILNVSNGKDKAYPPTGYWLGERKYPLERVIYLHIKESHWGLGRGFQKFACSQSGQLIIEKEGLQPYFFFDKQIILNNKPVGE
jgi:phosphate transport system substrate-binding protein